MIVLFTVLVYFAALLLLSRLVAGRGGNDVFFMAGRKSPWMLVAFGMVGASISGVSFIGVPGWVMTTDMTYLQMCLGFIAGYAVVAYVLLPLYYRLGLLSIYGYLLQRYGTVSYKTGATFFIINKVIGAAAKFYIVCRLLKECLSPAVDVPYVVVVAFTLLLIWFYTRKGGMKTLVWTDAFQTMCLLVALMLLLVKVVDMLGVDWKEAMSMVSDDSMSRIFVFDDIMSKQYFWKQFVSGVFVVIVMTGLDQDMMQKNLTCKDLKSAQKDMCSYGVLFVPVNLMLLSLGVLLVHLYGRLGVSLPAKGDELLAGLVLDGHMGTLCVVLFAIGVIASAFSSADSAMTSVTTSFCVDIMRKENDTKVRKMVHMSFLIVFVGVTLVFDAIGSGSIIDTIYTLVAYAYGPLLGLYAFGMLTKRRVKEKAVPWVAVAAPLLCMAADWLAKTWLGYHFGYELLLFNGMLTFVGLWCFSDGAICRAYGESDNDNML